MANEQNLIKFKPGQSGNPKGRPKGSKNISTYLKEFLECSLEVTNPISKKKEKLKLAAVIALKQIKNALNSDRQAINDIMDRLEGKPVQKQEIDANVNTIEVIDFGADEYGEDESNKGIQGKPKGKDADSS